MTEGREDEVKMGLLVVLVLFKIYIWFIYIKCMYVRYDFGMWHHISNINIKITLITFYFL